MVESFVGKVAVVTGGGSGIGRASAQMFAQRGASVVVADINADGGAETIELIRAAGGEAIFVRTDVSKAAEVAALIKQTISTYGRVDCAHNNAGVEGARAGIAVISEEEWDRVIAINLKGVMLCMKYEIGHMIEQGGGTIVNTSSVLGITAAGHAPAYCASKGGVIQLTRSAVLEYSKNNIRVNAVCPGSIETPMLDRAVNFDPNTKAEFAASHPVGRLGTPEEVASAVVWLCSDAASFVTGHIMLVDGGLTV